MSLSNFKIKVIQKSSNRLSKSFNVAQNVERQLKTSDKILSKIRRRLQSTSHNYYSPKNKNISKNPKNGLKVKNTHPHTDSQSTINSMKKHQTIEKMKKETNEYLNAVRNHRKKMFNFEAHIEHKPFHS